MQMSIPILIISVVLFLILFFGIGFLLNMLFRQSWIMVIIYPLIAIYIVNDMKLINYFNTPTEAFTGIPGKVASLALADIIILLSGLVGAILSGVTIRLLRKMGYRMF
ncbi:YuiB family protein [Peribacillus acanthi]|uniref:YuiB family protein n=1 Tax=Peribacillus acanthi TaxID=2171554 RepID=UPI000D3ECAC3|nr:YuiB family protein [Peribacillus acanthi]